MYELERDVETTQALPRIIGIADLDTAPLPMERDTNAIDLFGEETGCNHPFFACFGVSLLIVLWSTVILIVLFR